MLFKFFAIFLSQALGASFITSITCRLPKVNKSIYKFNGKKSNPIKYSSCHGINYLSDKKQETAIVRGFLFQNISSVGRGERIRTSGFMLPRHALSP
jgi:hypothetical protein